MTIDISAWKINDPEWKHMREKQWPFFEKWFLLRNASYEREKKGILKECLINVKRFYDEGFLDEKIENPDRDWPTSVGFWNALPLHPNLTPSAFRELLNYSGFKKYSLKGSFGSYYLMRSSHLDLIEAGVLPESYVLALMEGAYGHSMDEAAEILGFKVEEQYYNVVYNLGPILYLYYFSDNNDKLTYHTANLLLPHYIESLTHINDKEAEDCDFIFAQHVKRKKKYFDGNLVTDPERVDFMKRLLKEIQERWSDITPVAQEKLKGLFE